ncbi:MAG TPA: IS21 family transposase, partial [Candidatus Binatia bacterium]|nr:IS21 family transposase [Candidatus Binatia bacterium]
MAYREVEMWEILDVLRRVHRGETRAAIQRATGRTRKTVRRYVERARKLGWDPSGAEPDEALALEVARRLKPIGGEGAGESEARLVEHREQIRKWVVPEDGSRGLRLTKVQDLLERLGVRVPYSSLYRFA